MNARWNRRLSLVAIVGPCTLAVVAALGAVALAPAAAFPTLMPGGKAVIVKTDVSCTVTAATVLCEKAGGLGATLAAGKNTVQLVRNPAPIGAAPKSMKLGNNGGFIIIGQEGNNIYCHVYLSGGLTMSCAVNGGSSAGARGFDISDGSVVLFRYDGQGNRHNLETVQQP